MDDGALVVALTLARNEDTMQVTGAMAFFHDNEAAIHEAIQEARNLYSCGDMKHFRLTQIVRDAKISPKRLQMNFSIPLCSCGATPHTTKAVSLLPVITC